MTKDEGALRALATEFGQGHVFDFWGQLNADGRAALLAQLDQVDFPLMDRLAREWVLDQPAPEVFRDITPVPALPVASKDDPAAREAWDAGEEQLRGGKVGIFLVAGGQGTRLGFPGPKGCYPIGPITQKTIFQYHAEKINNLERRYGCVIPWYIMVSDTNEAATRDYFEANRYFGLSSQAVTFLKQRMVPCMDENGRFMLEAPGRLAMNPNGHGGCIPAMVENGVIDDARRRGVEMLSYFQVDNWAVKVADPYFIGYHALRGAAMSSKVHRKREPRESVGVHCLCDGVYRVVEYSELDIYPQLLETDSDGNVVYYAGNPAMHILSTDFVQSTYDRFDEFPWHLAHKKIAFLDADGQLVKPDKPNAYKFETFVFDALRFATHPPVALEIHPLGEYTPTKQFDGDNSVVAARQSMANLWGGWLERTGCIVPRKTDGDVAVPIEISPAFALDEEEFRAFSQGQSWEIGDGLAIAADGTVTRP
jgi:UDP-N-acetylglucosamine/UDP-N-acetylgalactosamine diphosphorylase